jgi:hypothetical protein
MRLGRATRIWHPVGYLKEQPVAAEAVVVFQRQAWPGPLYRFGEPALFAVFLGAGGGLLGCGLVVG